ncbi:MAG: radical SAM protein [Desulfomonile tiedjei]|nr:radical SAM protein [Desulfomonile tiedjei]
MAVIALVCMYDHRALGVRSISNALQAAGHQAIVVHFKLPATGFTPRYSEHATHYESISTTEFGTHFGIRTYNFDTNPWTHAEITLARDLLRTIRPDIIGLSTRSCYEEQLSEIISILDVPGSLKVAGGFGATFNPDLYLEHFDCVCVGPGEIALRNMADRIDRQDKPFTGIENLIYRENGAVVRNPLQFHGKEDFLYNFATLSVRHFVVEGGHVFSADPFLQKKHIPSHSDMASYHTMVGIGCVNNCHFCCAGKMARLSSGRNRWMRPIENVIEELKFAKGYGFQKVVFLDSFLMAPRNYLIDFFSKYEKEIRLPFFAQLYPIQILSHPDILDAAVHAGMDYTAVGLQSGSDRVNKNVFNRHTTLQKIVEFAALFEKYPSVMIQYHLITHNPFVDANAFEETLDTIGKLPKKRAELVLIRLQPFPGTAIADMVRKLPEGTGLLKDDFDRRALLYTLRFLMGEDEFKPVFTNETRYDFEKLLELVATNISRSPVAACTKAGPEASEGSKTGSLGSNSDESFTRRNAMPSDHREPIQQRRPEECLTRARRFTLAVLNLIESFGDFLVRGARWSKRRL